MKLLFLFSLVVAISCSFKPESKNDNKSSNTLRIDPSLADTDGDGLNDSLDADPHLANVPVFEGEMLEEIRIGTIFYNRSTDKFSRTELHVKSDDENVVVKKGLSFVRAIVEDSAAYTPTTNAHFSAKINDTLIDLYSAPIISDGAAHNFMAMSSELESQGFFLDSVEFEIRNRINLKSDRFKNFRDIIFDVYFYDYQTKRLEFLDSYKNAGSFEFNKDHLLDIPNIKTRNTRIMDNSVLKTGKFLYVKLKDFYIPELKLNYSDVMLSVKKQSIPLLVNSPDDYRVYYVGTSGSPSQFMSILRSSLKEDFEVDENRFIKYKDYPVGEYRVEDDEGNRINITSKWHIVTNEINNNPFSYSFLPTDLIFLNYSKSNDPVFFAKTVANSFSDTKKEVLLKGENLLPQALRKIKIILSSLVALQPKLQEGYVRYNNCGSHINRNQYNTYLKTTVVINPEPILGNDERLTALLKNTSLEIDGFEYPLLKLLNEKKFSLSVDSESKVILESSEAFIKSVRGLGEDLVRFSIIHKGQSEDITTGERMTDCKCYSCGGGGCGEDPQTCQRIATNSSTNSYPLNYTFYTSVFIF